MYIVYLTIYSGSNLPPYYIGSTSLSKYNDGYYGSVVSKKYKSIWKQELKDHPDLFDVLILSEHQTREEALKEELRLHILKNVVKSSLFINQSLATERGFIGMPRTTQHNQNIGKTKIGIPRPQDVIDKIIKTKQLYKESFRESCRNRSSHNQPIYIDNIWYRSIGEASRQLSIPRRTIEQRIKSKTFPTYRRE